MSKHRDRTRYAAIIADAGRRYFRLITTGSGPSVSGPTITFQIARADIVPNEDLVAPVDIWFAPTNIVGAMGVNGSPIAQPDAGTNAYDPTQLEIFWSWGFDDAGYTPFVTPNMPASMRGLNTSRVKRPTHVFTQPGNKTVTAFVTDTQGNYGFASYVFGPGGQAPTIANPDTHFVGREIYFSQAGIFPAGSAAIDQCTTGGAVNNRLTTLFSGGATMVRLRTRRGEVYTNFGEVGGHRNLYIDSYGAPGDPIPKHVVTNAGAGCYFAVANTAPSTRTPRVIDQEWEGPYNATTETGRRFDALISGSSANGAHILISRCKVGGMAKLRLTSSNSEMWRTIHDCDITNWQDYGLYPMEGNGLLNLAVLSCDIYQKLDALSGIPHDAGSGNPWDLGNRHGPCRHKDVRTLHVSGNSFFTRCGWSIADPLNGTTIQPTTAQLCWRYGGTVASTVLTHHGFERNSMEGGDAIFGIVSFGRTTDTYASNFLFDGNIFAASTQTNMFSDGFIIGNARGLAIRNNHIVTPAVTIQNGGGQTKTFRAVSWTWNGAVTGAKAAFVHNNTWLILATTAQFGAGTRVFTDISADHAPVVDSNILHAPNLTAAQPGPAPLTTSAIAGFTPRYLGDRWNFLAYGSPTFVPNTAQARREQPGSPGVLQPGPVANLEWMFFAYPNLTNQCRGAGRQLVQSDFADGTLYHQVSFSGGGGKALSTVAAGDARDQVAFRFDANGFAVQNRTGVTLSAGDVWISFDLPALRMAMDTSRATPQGSMLWAIPGVGSAGRIATRTVPWPLVDIGQTARGGMRQSSDTVTAEGVNFAGAAVAVPA